MTSRTCSSSRPSSRTCSARRGASSARASSTRSCSRLRNGWRRTPSGCRFSRASECLHEDAGAARDAVGVLRVFGRGATGGSPAQRAAFNAVAAAAQRYRTLRRGLGNEVRADNIAFAPQYPLWSDGTSKRRWIYLPPGAAIDASRVDAWEFPVGTRLWKEFSYDRRVETRFIERLADGSWRFAAYVWNKRGTDAVLAAEDGAVLPSAPRPVAVTSFRRATIAWRAMKARRCRCSASARCSCRPIAIRSRRMPSRRETITRIYRASLRADGCATCRRVYVEQPPRIAATSPTARAALGYLHGNCGHCHNDAGALTGLELVLAQQAETPRKAPSERCSHCSATRAASVRRAPTARSASRAMAARTC